MVLRFAGVLVRCDEVRRGDAAAPHLRLEGLDQPLDRFLRLAALRLERSGAAVGDHGQEAALRERAFDRIVHHVVRDDALFGTLDRVGRQVGALDQEIVVLAVALGECELHWTPASPLAPHALAPKAFPWLATALRA